MFLPVNGLDPTTFTSVAELESRIVAFARDVLHGDEGTVGSVTSGGTESCMLAVKSARDLWRATHGATERPTLVLPTTAHPAFHKAAHYLDLDVLAVPVDPRTGAPTAADVLARVDERTALVVVSAPSYPFGVIDPVAEVAAAAGVPVHVDACIGGWVLPWWGGIDASRGTSRSRASPRSRPTCTSSATPPRAPRSCSTGPGSSTARSTSRRRPGRATRWSTRRCSARAASGRWRPRGRSCRCSARAAWRELVGGHAQATDTLVAAVSGIGRPAGRRQPDRAAASRSPTDEAPVRRPGRPVPADRRGPPPRVPPAGAAGDDAARRLDAAPHRAPDGHARDGDASSTSSSRPSPPRLPPRCAGCRRPRRTRRWRAAVLSDGLPDDLAVVMATLEALPAEVVQPLLVEVLAATVDPAREGRSGR